jgi:DNA-binding SARP family transcriptional activator
VSNSSSTGASPAGAGAAAIAARGPLEIRLFGGCEIRFGAGTVDPATKKARALLAYLALSPDRPQPREKLQDLFWSQSGKAQAQASLRQTLFLLKRSLPVETQGALVVTSAAVGLEPSRVRVDVDALERHVASATTDALDRVAEIYAGPFLEGFALDEASFDEWVEHERIRLRDLALGGLDELAGRQADAGEVNRAIQTALLSLRLEPLHEPSHRRLMGLYSRSGQRAAAVQQYRTCVAALDRALGVEPEEQTKRRYLEILHPPAPVAPENAVVGDAGVALAPEPVVPWPPLVGRGLEMVLLGRALEQSWAGSGAGPFVLLTGDAGVGKTRILEEGAARATALGGRCLRGRCFESEQVLPFAPWVDLLRSTDGWPDAGLWRRLEPAWRTELARIMPGARPPGTPIDPRSPNPQDAMALFEAVGGLLACASEQAPLLVVLEDLHWSDAMSLRVLPFLVRRIAPGSRLSVMASVRSEELAGATLLRTVLNEVDREQRLQSIEVAPLSHDDTLALVRAIASRGGAPAGPTSADAVWRASEGNPLVVVEACRALERGTVAGDDRVPVPGRVRDLITGHFDRLDPLSQNLLTVAAVIGREFDFAWLQRACGCDARVLAAAVESLVSTRILQGSAAGAYFTHDRVREVVYERLLPARRRVLHGEIARALEALSAGRADEVADALAYHYARAGDEVAGVDRLLRFADRCMGRVRKLV